MPSPAGGTKSNRAKIIATVVRSPSFELPGPASKLKLLNSILKSNDLGLVYTSSTKVGRCNIFYFILKQDTKRFVKVMKRLMLKERRCKSCRFGSYLANKQIDGYLFAK